MGTTGTMLRCAIVGENVDTWILNVRGELAEDLAAHLDSLKAEALEDDVPTRDDGTHFLIWFLNWLETYPQEKGVTYEAITEAKRLKLGVVMQDAAA